MTEFRYTPTICLIRKTLHNWQQRHFGLYCLGKDNGENIMKSFTEGPFQMGTVIETLAEGTEGALHRGPERARVFGDLSAEDKERYKSDIHVRISYFKALPKDTSTHSSTTLLSQEHLGQLTEWMMERSDNQPLPASVSPTVLSPDYLADSKLMEEDSEEDPKEDPKEEPFEEEEEPLALVVSASALLDSVSAYKETEPFEEDETLLPSSFDEHIEAWRTALASPLPPPSSLSPLTSSLPKIPSPSLLLPLPTPRDIIPKADMPPQKRARFAAPSHRFEIGESSAAVAARQHGSALTRGTEYGFVTALEEDDKAVLRARISSLEGERRYHRARAIAAEQESTYSREA
ncbi:hypothetical protein Tco_0408449 [Tanacetum coccineum]